MELLIATHNRGKFGEIAEVLADLPIRLLSLRDMAWEDEVAEDFPTHEENALHKARYFYNKLSCAQTGAHETQPSLASRSARGLAIMKNFFNKMEQGKEAEISVLGEDSGVYVDAFPGQLGVFTKRWAGLEKATDGEWVAYFLKRMESVPEEKRTARFACCGALVINGKEHIFSGETTGRITRTLQAPLLPGIPLSSCFIPDDATKVYAALTLQEKTRISHRGKVMRQVKDVLNKYFPGNLYQ